MGAERWDIASMADLLQFAYEQEQPVWSLPPRLNNANFERLVKEADRWYGAEFETRPERIDMRREISRCGAVAAVDQLVDFGLAMRRIVQADSPQDKVVRLNKLYADFRQDPDNHVILRQFLPYSPFETDLSLAGTETRRRAVHIVVALHEVRDRLGTWPRDLRQIRPIVPEGRTD